MSLRDIGEFGFIKRISQGCLIRPEHVVKAIGDDAAAFETPAGLISLMTTDMLVARVHFLREATSGFDLGYKSLAVNLSDIAAMGGTAREAFVSIAIPDDCELAYLQEIYRGMKCLAQKFEVNILGGDTTGSKIDLVINVAVYGVVAPDQILYRRGARPGDIIFCTGHLGDSSAGLQSILKAQPIDTPALQRLRDAHLRPEPHLSEGRFLATSAGVSAAIDVSDGLGSDLGHILDESQVGAILYAADIPLSEELVEFCQRTGGDPLEFALSGGEDYVLLGTCRADRADAIAAGFDNKFNRKFFRIGEITAETDRLIVLSDGRSRPLDSQGWDHFKENL
jgi:thiamine-monophosphate kinase